MATSTALPTVTELVLDHTGILATDGELVYYLTSCCRASAKGSANSPTGVCCRGCYRAIPAQMGAGWLIGDAAAWAQWRDVELASYYAEHPSNRTSGLPEQILDRVAGKVAEIVG